LCNFLHSPLTLSLLSQNIDIYMSKGYFIIVWPCAPSCKIVTSELIPLFFFATLTSELIPLFFFRNVDVRTRSAVFFSQHWRQNSFRCFFATLTLEHVT
jgi:hypothetical protein